MFRSDAPSAPTFCRERTWRWDGVDHSLAALALKKAFKEIGYG
jgi:hypothetical protein